MENTVFFKLDLSYLTKKHIRLKLKKHITTTPWMLILIEKVFQYTGRQRNWPMTMQPY